MDFLSIVNTEAFSLTSPEAAVWIRLGFVPEFRSPSAEKSVTAYVIRSLQYLTTYYRYIYTFMIRPLASECFRRMSQYLLVLESWKSDILKISQLKPRHLEGFLIYLK